MKRRVRMEERTTWGWWVYLLLAGLFWVLPLFTLLPESLGRGGGGMSPGAAATLFLVLAPLPLLLFLFLGQLRIRVTDDAVEAAWGVAEVFKKRFPFQEILRAEAVTYSPLREFGGWGVRMGLGKKRAWTTRGNRALVLHLTDGTRFYLTSDRPERLVVNIQAAGAGKMGRDTEDGDTEGGKTEGRKTEGRKTEGRKTDGGKTGAGDTETRGGVRG